MITGQFNNEKVNIPTSWTDVKYKDYIRYLECTTAIEQASVLLGVPIDTLNKMNSESLGALLMAMAFMNDEPNAYLPELQQIDIGKATYGQLETAKALLQRHEKAYKAIIDIIKVYTNIDYSDYPTDIVHPLGSFFLLSCLSSLNATKD
jgi:hypothetical protein